MLALLLELLGVILVGTGAVVAFGWPGVSIVVGLVSLLVGLFIEGDG